VIQIDEGKIQEHLDEVVLSTVEETLNALLRRRSQASLQEASSFGAQQNGRI